MVGDICYSQLVSSFPGQSYCAFGYVIGITMLKRAIACQFAFQASRSTAERNTPGKRQPGIEIFTQSVLHPVNIRITGDLSVSILAYFRTCLPPGDSPIFEMGFTNKRTPILIDDFYISWHLELSWHMDWLT